MRTLMMTIAILILAAARSEGHDIYSGLTSHIGASCCDERDCRPAQYRITSVGVEMLLDGEWVRVPDSVIQYRSLEGDTGKTRGGHWCGVEERYDHPPHPNHPAFRFSTRCAILPPGLF
jgi:hypothetical protein